MLRQSRQEREINPLYGKTGPRENRHKGVIVSTRENVEIARKAYAAFAAGDLETTFGILDDSIEWFNPGNSKVSGTYRGKAQFTELVGKLAETEEVS